MTSPTPQQGHSHTEEHAMDTLAHLTERVLMDTLTTHRPQLVADLSALRWRGESKDTILALVTSAGATGLTLRAIAALLDHEGDTPQDV